MTTPGAEALQSGLDALIETQKAMLDIAAKPPRCRVAELYCNLKTARGNLVAELLRGCLKLQYGRKEGVFKWPTNKRATAKTMVDSVNSEAYAKATA